MIEITEKVLIVDDEWKMRNLIKINLLPNYSVDEASSGQEALEKHQNEKYQLIILDVMMPDMSGWTVCEKIREMDNTPILMLTALQDVKDKVHGLRIGADDYLVKPFDPEELLARVEALLRRSNDYNQAEEESTVKVAGLTINKTSRQVHINGEEIELTPKEFDLMHLLASNHKRVFTRDVLLDLIWDTNTVFDVRTVDTHVKNIREKCRRNGLPFNPIKTVWGVGYTFQRPEANG